MTHSQNRSFDNIGSAGGQRVTGQVGTDRHDLRVFDVHYTGCDDYHPEQPYADGGRWVDVYWSRTNMFGASSVAQGFAGINDFDSMSQRWEWDWPASGKKQRKMITGITVDQYGNRLANVVVRLYNWATGLFVDSNISDAAGNFSLGDPNNVASQVTAYLAGSPDTEGITVNTLTGS